MTESDRFIWHTGDLRDAALVTLPSPLGGVVWATPDTPVDLLLTTGDGQLHGIDLRVLAGRQQDELSVPERVVAHAKRWARSKRVVLHTIVMDERQLIARSVHGFYYRRGMLARVVVQQMIPVMHRTHLLDMINMPANEMAALLREVDETRRRLLET